MRIIDPIEPRHPFDLTRRLLCHSDRLAEWVAGKDTFPVSMEVNLTNRCNMACGWCITEYAHENGDPGLDTERLLSCLREYSSLGGRSVTWSGGGEPTLHRAFKEIVRAVSEIGLDQGLLTNGLFSKGIAREVATHCKWIRVSLDTYDEEAYAKEKNVSKAAFHRVIRNIRQMVRFRDGCRIGINMNVAGWNRDHIRGTYEFGVSMGVDYLQIRPVLAVKRPLRNARYNVRLETEAVRDIIETIRSIRTRPATRLIASMDKFGDLLEAPGAERPYDSCLYHHLVCVLDSDGSLCVCMFHLKDDRFIFGNLHRQTLEGIWKGSRRRRVVELTRNMDFSICQACCKGHEVNRIMHGVFNPPRGKNFL